MKLSALLNLLVAVCLLFLSSCSKQATTSSSDLVVCTTTMVADLVREIGGDAVTVEALMKAQVDPHLYKASPSDVSKLNRAKVVFYSGMLLEGRMTDIFNRLADQGKAVHAVTDSVPEKKRIESEEYEGHPDPHVWGDASLWMTAADVVAERLAEAFPDHAESFQKRRMAYRKTLADLDRWAKERIDSIPPSRRKLVTSHDAFSYFGRAYGLDVIGVQGISTASDPSLADRTRMVDFIKKHQIPAIFVESSVSPVLIEQISRDANVKVGGELFSDALGEPGTMESGDGESYDVGTYVGMIKHNVNTVVSALR